MSLPDVSADWQVIIHPSLVYYLHIHTYPVQSPRGRRKSIRAHSGWEVEASYQSINPTNLHVFVSQEEIIDSIKYGRRFQDLKSEVNAESSWTCILFDSQQGATPMVSKTVQLYISLWEKDPSSHLSDYLDKQFPVEFMVSFASFKSSLEQHDVNFVNDGFIYRKVDDKAGGYVLGCGKFVIEMMIITWLTETSDNSRKF